MYWYFIQNIDGYYQMKSPWNDPRFSFIASLIVLVSMLALMTVLFERYEDIHRQTRREIGWLMTCAPFWFGASDRFEEDLEGVLIVHSILVLMIGFRLELFG